MNNKKRRSAAPVPPTATTTTAEISAPVPKAETKEEIATDTENVMDLEVAKKMIKISQSASDRKLEFNLSFETVKKLLQFKRCYYTGRLFGAEGGPDGRSFDRVDSSKGYIEGNVVACTIDINQKKSNLSLEEITCLYNKLIKRE